MTPNRLSKATCGLLVLITAACHAVVVEEPPPPPRRPHVAQVVIIQPASTPQPGRGVSSSPRAGPQPNVGPSRGANQGVDPQLERLVGDCRAPSAVTSCDSLRTWYLATAPRPREGTDSPNPYQQAQLEKRRQTAKEILDAAAPALRVFAEAQLWSNVDLPRCSSATTRDDCLSVATYLARYPDGKHVQEAHAVYDAADRRLAAKERQAAAASHRSSPTHPSAARDSTTAPNLDHLRAECLNRCAAQGDTADDAAMVQGCVNQCGEGNTDCVIQCRQIDHHGTTGDRCAAACANQYGMP